MPRRAVSCGDSCRKSCRWRRGSLAAFAIRALHTPLTLALQDHIGTDITTALLAFTLLLLIPYAAMKVIANNVGAVSRSSMLGPVDRVLGFGFRRA